MPAPWRKVFPGTWGTSEAAFSNALPGKLVVEAMLGAASTPPALNATVAYTEAQDAASLQATVTSGVTPANLTLVATDAMDTPSFVVSVTVAFTLSASEAQDGASLQVGLVGAAQLLATEAQDTAAFQTTAHIGLTMDATDAQDALSAYLDAPIGFSMDALEAQDAAFLRTDGGTQASDAILVTGMLVNMGTLLNRS